MFGEGEGDDGEKGGGEGECVLEYLNGGVVMWWGNSFEREGWRWRRREMSADGIFD